MSSEATGFSAVAAWADEMERTLEPLQAVGAALGADPMQFILGGGDDHSLLATFPDAASVPSGWQVIGEVREGEGVTVDGGTYDGPTGWTHF